MVDVRRPVVAPVYPPFRFGEPLLETCIYIIVLMYLIGFFFQRIWKQQDGAVLLLLEAHSNIHLDVLA